MSLLWHSVSFLLAVELVVLFGLCAPLPWGVRKNISRWIFRIRAYERMDALFKYVLFGLLLALTESLHSLRSVHVRREFRSTNSESADAALQIAALQDFRWQQARAERNLYLVSFSITGIIAIVRLIKLAWIEVQLRNKIKSYNGNKPLTETGETINDKDS